MKKKLLSVLIACAMILTLLPATAAAANAFVSDESELQSAIASANRGDTITLGAAVTSSEKLLIPEDKSLTLDLDGQTLTLLQLRVEGALTICDSGSGGKLVATINEGENNGAVEVGAKGRLTLESGTIEAPEYGVFVSSGGTAVVNGGTIASYYAALAGNNRTGDVHFEVHGGTLTADFGPAIYMPGQVSLEITGGTLNGGISLRMGQVTISGGTIRAITDHIDSPAEYYDYSGNAWLPDALYVFNGTYTYEGNETYGNSLNLNITGGTFECTNDQGSAVAIYDLGKVEQESNIRISGTASLSSTAADRGAYQVLSLEDIQVEDADYGKYSGAVKTTITGGTFSSDVREYVEDGYFQNSAGMVGTLDEVAAAQIGGQKYLTLSEAFAAAEAGQTVTLLKDTYLTETIVTDAEDVITLDLNGRAITVQKTGNRSLYAINNYGTLTITDNSAAQTGSITARGVQNYPGATMTIAGGRITAADDGGGAGVWCYQNSVLNMSGGILEATGGLSTDGSRIAANPIVASQGEPNVVINITGGTLRSTYKVINVNDATSVTLRNCRIEITGDPAVTDQAVYIYGDTRVDMENVTIVGKNGAGGVQVNGGTASIRNCSITQTGNGMPGYVSCAVAASRGAQITIEGGTYASDQISAYVYNSGGTITIEDGTFIGDLKADNSSGAPSQIYVQGGAFQGGYSIGSQSTLSISGGYFTSDPSEYAANDKAVLTSDTDGYAFMVGSKVDTAVEVTPAAGDPVVDMTQIAPADQTVVQAAAESVSDNGELTAAANSVLDQVTEEQRSDAVDAYMASSIAGGTAEEDINVYVQTYLDIKPTAYSVESNTLTLDITPMYRVVASTAETPEDIKVYDPEAGTGDANAVVLGSSEKKLTSVKTMTLSITLPNGFVDDAETPVYVQHKGYEYTATVIQSGTDYSATFTNPHGFSPFTITTESAAEAMLNGIGYDTLANALADAGDGDTVQVLQDNLTASMSGSSRKITLSNGSNADPLTVTINGTAVHIDRNGTADFTYTAPSSSGSTGYAVSVTAAANGKVTVSASRASKGTTVTITTAPDTGYALDTLTVTDKDGKAVALTEAGNGKYTFRMPASAVTVKAAFAKKSLPFTDVSGHWALDAITYAYDAGMMNGVTTTEFAPEAELTRGMIVTMLYRLENAPAVSGSTFTDVNPEQYYAAPIAWAAESGIVEGYGDGTFGPENSITREQLAAIFYRYAQYKDYDVSVGEDTNILSYLDVAEISEYAIPAFQWACGSGIINGVTESTLVPRGTATRAQIATMLMRFCETVAK